MFFLVKRIFLHLGDEECRPLSITLCNKYTFSCFHHCVYKLNVSCFFLIVLLYFRQRCTQFGGITCWCNISSSKLVSVRRNCNRSRKAWHGKNGNEVCESIHFVVFQWWGVLKKIFLSKKVTLLKSFSTNSRVKESYYGLKISSWSFINLRISLSENAPSIISR